jgi:hypothetical protein
MGLQVFTRLYKVIAAAQPIGMRLKAMVAPASS